VGAREFKIIWNLIRHALPAERRAVSDEWDLAGGREFEDEDDVWIR
jgi:hypothetical protein